MLDGHVKFPPDFAAAYRAKGYWRDRSLRDEFADHVFAPFADRVAAIDGDVRVTYAGLDAISTRLALNLWDLGLRPLDRAVVMLPNVIEFVYLYFALQKLGAIPICALATHRYHELSQFTHIAQAKLCVAPDRARDFAFAPTIARVQGESRCLEHAAILGEAPPGFLSFRALLDAEPRCDASVLDGIRIDPTDPAVFQLSGGTTGVPKLIPRTHNDYWFNSNLATTVTEVTPESCLLLVLPIGHNLPLACPGLQGFMIRGARVVLSTSARPADVFRLVQEHGVTHIHVVPALLIRWINDPDIGKYDLSSLRMIQSGGQRLQPEIRLKTRALIPSVFVQENFGMSEGTLMFVRTGDPEDVQLETVGRPICEDDEVRLIGEDGSEVAFGEVGELCVRGPYTLRGYYGAAEHNAKVFTPDGFYCSGDLMRQHPSGNYMVEGRIKDVINRGGEKISAEEIENLILQHPAVQNVACVAMPDAVLGEKMCACVIPKAGATLDFDSLIGFLEGKEFARHKLPERLELMDDFPLSTFGKVSKKSLAEAVAARLAAEARTD
ncbi:MAG: AMP-binding protein [Alphaproteobacteria bacterium]|nr:AMP-binding protein [Alphaproteobacteria bacterium]